MSQSFLPMQTFGLSVDGNGVIWEYRGAFGFIPVGQYLPVFPPSNASPPVATMVAGPPVVGGTATCNVGTWTPAAPTPTYARQWYSDGVLIPGATTTGYTIQASDLDHDINCVVTATNAAGSASATSNALGPVGPAP